MKDQEPQVIAIAKERKRERRQGQYQPLGGGPRELSSDELEEVSRDHLGAVGVVAFIIGLWGLSALIAALVSVGGPLALLHNWYQAVTGLW